jgi:putative SOS response-associated peptidase YedK
MCNRYVFQTTPDDAADRYDASIEDRWEPSFNIAPQSDAPVVRQNSPRRITLLHWGLVPHWADDTSIGSKLLNARAETVDEKPAFRDAYRQRRCIIPANGFYEWTGKKGTKQPFYLTVPDQDIISLAGLWEHWQQDGDEVISFTIITCPPNELVSEVHDRMPVILEQDDEDDWLDGTADKAVLDPYPADKMALRPVSRRVNSPTNDGPELIEEQTGLDAYG